MVKLTALYLMAKSRRCCDKVEGEKGDLDLLFVAPSVHSKGIGYAAWCEVEKLHPEVKVWETVTPISSSGISIFM